MSAPKSGDPCSRAKCGGHLVVYTSRLIDHGRRRQRFYRCVRCGATAPTCSVEPSTQPSTAVYRDSERIRDNAGMDTPTERKNDPWAWDILTPWETATFCGLDIFDVLALAEDGKFPQPVSQWPLRWAEQDVGRWWMEQQQKAIAQ